MTKMLHDADSALRPRSLVGWILFAGGAGAVNGVAFLACERFVTHVTGTVTLIGLDAGLWRLMAEYGLLLICFVAGALTSVLVIRRSAYSTALVGTVGLLVLVTALGLAGLFGPFGGSVEQAGDFALLSLLSFAMGLQNATVASASPLSLRTTHMTGPASDLGVHLGNAVLSLGDQRALALRLAGVRAVKLVAFIVGAAVAVVAARALGFAAFLVPAVLIAAATLLSLEKEEEKLHANDEARAFRNAGA